VPNIDIKYELWMISHEVLLLLMNQEAFLEVKLQLRWCKMKQIDNMMNIYGKSSITLELRWCCGIFLPLASADEIQEKSR